MIFLKLILNGLLCPAWEGDAPQMFLRDYFDTSAPWGSDSSAQQPTQNWRGPEAACIFAHTVGSRSQQTGEAAVDHPRVTEGVTACVPKTEGRTR